ncbi:hypothetical protein CCH79_00019914 [Gambusia affinis]|uniref:Uncharacterized protein n=1 Tax=Gambusia affinis TaxID=33528 RepID=A0A315WCF3_GAMAF|nr:hypothetical protein CCH79_00019914 [Gambusia affinis]
MLVLQGQELMEDETELIGDPSDLNVKMAEVDEIVKRLQAQKGVEGVIIANSEELALRANDKVPSGDRGSAGPVLVTPAWRKKLPPQFAAIMRLRSLKQLYLFQKHLRLFSSTLTRSETLEPPVRRNQEMQKAVFLSGDELRGAALLTSTSGSSSLKLQRHSALNTRNYDQP